MTTTPFDTLTPTKLTGKDLERLCLLDAEWSEARGLYTMNRYGVQVSIMRDKATGLAKPLPVASLPDFEGLIPSGQQFVFDCKVCSGPSFPLKDDHFRRRQLAHLLRRDRFGALCFLLLHFNARQLATKAVDAATFAFPVSARMPFWQRFDRGEVKSITRLDCEAEGVGVPWHCPERARLARPSLLATLLQLEATP